jgi:hypothetical protein
MMALECKGRFRSHALRALAGLVLFPALAMAQSATGTAGTTSGVAPKGPYRIAGVMINAVTGEPIHRATVAVLGEEDSHTIASTASDSEGRFSLESLPAAKYQLTASKRGFRTAFYDEHDEYSSAIVTGADQDTSHLVFKMIPGGIVRGVVSSDGGDAVEGARVMLFRRPKHPRLGERTAQVDAAVTDDTGTYEFSDLAGGEYMLAVMADPWYAMRSPVPRGPAAPRDAARDALDVAYGVTYYDSVTDEGAATPIVLAGGGHEEANISLHAVPAVHLSVDSPQKPDGTFAPADLQQAIFGVAVMSRDVGNTMEIHEGGVSEVSGLAPGKYLLTQGDPPRVAELDLAGSLHADPNAGVLTASVSGTLLMVSGRVAPEDVNLTLDRIDGGPGQNEFVTAAHGGSFKFDTVPAGTWSILANDGSNVLSVVSVVGGGLSHSGNSLAVRDRSLNVQVNVSQGQTTIDGFARKDGKGLAGVMVVLLPKDPARWQALTRRDQSDSDGSFALRDAAPGQYTVVAIEDGWELDWSRPEAMARFLPRGTAVTVTDKSGTKLELGAAVMVQAR